MNTIAPRNSPCPWNPPSFTTTVPDMLSGGAVELIFIAWFVSDILIPAQFSPSGPTTITATSTISGSLRCDGTELKLADDPQIQLTYTRIWDGPPTTANCILSVTFTSTGGGTELDTFNAWVTSIMVEGYTRNF